MQLTRRQKRMWVIAAAALLAVVIGYTIPVFIWDVVGSPPRWIGFAGMLVVTIALPFLLLAPTGEQMRRGK